MRNTTKLATVALLSLVAASAAMAQQATPESTGTTAPDTTTAPAKASLVPPIEMQHIRPQDQRGINVFETPKNDAVPFTGFRLGFGAAFAQSFQGLRHQNTAANNTGAGANSLMVLGNGFNTASANLFLNAQVAPGIRVAMTSYLSSRHHNETWVKDGYFLIDASPIDNPILNNIMKYTTLKVGHFEINYGDSHFRRSDNGQVLYNPFVGNQLMDAFTTEIGGEVYFRRGPWLAMGGITGGEIKGDVTNPQKRAPSYIGKFGFDEQLTPALRTRLTASMYSTYKSASNTLFSGSRSGSPYMMVMENTAASTSAQAWSGDVQPKFGSKVSSWVVNPFIKFNGLEFFGNYEKATGRGVISATEPADRTFTQTSGDVVYRFLNDQFYVAGRYNTVSGTYMLTNAGATNAYDISVNRAQLGAGWFITPVVLFKAEYVRQQYNDFPTFDIRNGGKFNGFMVQGAVAF